MHDQSIPAGNHTGDCDSICDQFSDPKSISRVISYSVGHIFGGNGCAQRGSDVDHMCGIKPVEGQKHH